MWLPMTRRLRGVCDRGAGRFGGSRVDGESPKKDIGTVVAALVLVP
jgi:hypothetical protein